MDVLVSKQFLSLLKFHTTKTTKLIVKKYALKLKLNEIIPCLSARATLKLSIDIYNMCSVEQI